MVQRVSTVQAPFRVCALPDSLATFVSTTRVSVSRRRAKMEAGVSRESTPLHVCASQALKDSCASPTQTSVCRHHA